MKLPLSLCSVLALVAATLSVVATAPVARAATAQKNRALLAAADALDARGRPALAQAMRATLPRVARIFIVRLHIIFGQGLVPCPKFSTSPYMGTRCRGW